MKLRTYAAFAAALVISGPARGQSNIDPINRFGWSENVGWSNWRGNGMTSGASVAATVLSGYVWFENIGWLNLGDGTPSGAPHYSNVDAADFGVNSDINGDLFGFAWGENVGWVNFDTASAGPGRARLDYCDRLRGFAWGENIGWINLDDATRFVGLDSSQPPPSGTPSLSVEVSAGSSLVFWTLLDTATAYDVAQGDLGTLRNTAGDFTLAATGCLGSKVIGTNGLLDAGIPDAGQGTWYVTRGVSCGSNGTYDSLAASQIGSRDAEINGSSFACP